MPLDQWKQLGADGLIIGTVRKTPAGVAVQVRLVDVATGRSALAKEYTGTLKNPRLYAHTASDEIHQQQRALRGVARTKLAFTSDRDGERMKGAGGRPRHLEHLHVRLRRRESDSPDRSRARSISRRRGRPTATTIAYTSYRTGFQDIIIQYIHELRDYVKPANGTSDKQNYLPAWSPDGSKLAFTTNRDGNPEIYVDEPGRQRTAPAHEHPEVDVTPTWSPTGKQIAWTSDRTGTPQIWIMNADGFGAAKDHERIVRATVRRGRLRRSTRSPYASRTGAGFDIEIYDFANRRDQDDHRRNRQQREPGVFAQRAARCVHSTRAGKEQIFIIDRDGKNLHQVDEDRHEPVSELVAVVS